MVTNSTMANFNICNELERLGTFLGWSDQVTLSKPVKPSALALAKAGFSYTGRGDEVHCFSCGLHVDGWERHHDPHVVHATRSPHCSLVAGSEPANRPVVVPPDREYAKIKAMLTELGLRATGTPVSVSDPTSCSLLAETLTLMYGEGMVPSRGPRSPHSNRTTSGSGLRAQRRSASNSASPSMSRRHTAATRSQSGTSRSPSRDNSTNSRRGSSSTAVISSPRRADGDPPLPGSTPPPRRCSSTSEVDSQAVAASTSTQHAPQSPGRPGFHRAHSYAPARPKHSRSLETNRQASGPATDHRLLQQSEEARLQTFEAWRGVRGATAVDFAQAGFIYIGRPDRVQCVVCRGILKNWNDNDQPIEEHRKHFPDCSFVKEYFARSSVSRSGPRHPNFTTVPSRRASFKNWTITRNPTPAELAQAGFFYAGHGDSVKCFHCDGGLRNWEPNDDPWREHAYWFPKCGFVQAVKGSAFITEVSKNCGEHQSASVDETELKNVTQGCAASGAGPSSTTGQRSVDPREVTARMDSPIVLAVLKMDVPRKYIKMAIKKQLSENGGDFTSAEALMEAVFKLDFAAIESEAEEVVKLEQQSATDTHEAREGASGGPASGEDAEESIRLSEEIRQLKEQRQCKVCMDEDVSIVFVPCGHLVCCATCAPALNNCPICRGKIRGTMRTYMS